MRVMLKLGSTYRESTGNAESVVKDLLSHPAMQVSEEQRKSTATLLLFTDTYGMVTVGGWELIKVPEDETLHPDTVFKVVKAVNNV